MTFALAVFAFPLLLAALSLGTGLLVERTAGMRIPAMLLPPIGFAGLVSITQLTTWQSAIAPLTPAIVVVVAALGVALGWRATAVRWRARRTGWWWPAAAGVGAWLVGIGPVLLAGRATFPGYLLDTTGSVQLMGAERLVTEGQSFEAVSTGYGLQLHGYFGNGYPSGSHSVLGGAGQLVGVDFVWLYAPYLACALGLAALVLTFVAGRAGLPRPAAAATGLVAAVPALVCAYALQGAIKEIVLLPTLLLLGALILLAREQAAAAPRGIIPLAVVGAAGWGTIGLAFTPWLGLATLAILAFGWRSLRGASRERAKVVALSAAGCTAVLAVLALPTVAPLGRSLTQTSAITSSNAQAAADPGNLLRPLLDAQIAGVWLGGSHRGDPEYLTTTYVLIGVVLVGIVMGIAWLIRRRRWEVLAFVAISVATWLLLDPRATTWTAAKLLVLLSPVVLLVALIGAFGRLGARRVDGLLVAAAIAGGVLGSDALLYHYTTLAPTQRFEELRKIGERFAGQGPTLAPDFDEYALYFLRDMAPDSPGNARRAIPWTLTGGEGIGYGRTYDVDALEQVQQVQTIVVRRSPFKSRPPASFRRTYQGDFYEVWTREPGADPPREHIALGEGPAPSRRLACDEARAIARRARAAGDERFVVAPTPPLTIAHLERARLRGSVSLTPVGAGPALAFVGPAEVTMRLRVPADGTYALWMRAQIGRLLTAAIDGRPVGVVSQQHGGDGNAVQFGIVRLTAGEHVLRLTRGGGSLRPADAAASYVEAIALERVANEARPVDTLPIEDWRALCGRRLDWIETV